MLKFAQKAVIIFLHSSGLAESCFSTGLGSENLDKSAWDQVQAQARAANTV